VADSICVGQYWFGFTSELHHIYYTLYILLLRPNS